MGFGVRKDIGVLFFFGKERTRNRRRQDERGDECVEWLYEHGFCLVFADLLLGGGRSSFGRLGVGPGVCAKTR